jgi:hypothetical protein
MMIGKRCSIYARKMYESYKTFTNDDWDKHSVRIPLQLYVSERDIARVEWGVAFVVRSDLIIYFSTE